MIHTGTNDLTNGVNTMKEIRKIVKCVRDLDKDKKFYIGFLSVIIRSYRNLGQEIRDLNLKLKRYCEGNNFLFVDNVNIEESCLNNSKLHLNYKGTNILCQTSKILYTIIEVQRTAVKLISLIWVCVRVLIRFCLT